MISWNGFVDTGQGRGHGINWEIGNDIQALVPHAQSLNPVQLFVIPWTAAHQAPLAMGFSRQDYWSGLTFPPPRDLPNPGVKPASPVYSALAAAVAAKSLQSWPTLYDPIDGSLLGSPVPGILQARTLEWVATSFSNA